MIWCFLVRCTSLLVLFRTSTPQTPNNHFFLWFHPVHKHKMALNNEVSPISDSSFFTGISPKPFDKAVIHLILTPTPTGGWNSTEFLQSADLRPLFRLRRGPASLSMIMKWWVWSYPFMVSYFEQGRNILECLMMIVGHFICSSHFLRFSLSFQAGQDFSTKTSSVKIWVWFVTGELIFGYLLGIVSLTVKVFIDAMSLPCIQSLCNFLGISGGPPVDSECFAVSPCLSFKTNYRNEATNRSV